MLKLAALVGPTAVGKTELAIKLAQKIGGEIISCDSMQVYRGMDIGTAKASPAQRDLVPHHLIDIAEPDLNFTVADYQRLAQQAIFKLNGSGRIPMLVGGTGLYYQAVVDNYDFFPMESLQTIRAQWEQICSDKGIEYLFKQLLAIDPAYAAKVGGNDKKRIIRALEVYDLTGRPFSSLQNQNKDTYRLCAIGLYMDRTELYARIEQRVDAMIKEGLVEEVARLREKGYDLSMNSMQALGYKQVYNYLEGLLTYAAMVYEIKKETRNFAKRQYTWFNRDKRIHWFNLTEFSNSEIILEKICDLMEGQLIRV
ncbi:MAG: tRNA (adenosine(37)-N6)-dimethylallyltransferase MiaA [Syntrophomonadaceae bacterium]|nr:tRNA (adenosine(37)-N6)-dimethylallyltransferase MiaA [Syntrophomonadaceae bacterium]